jgi:hypothetical protein
VTPADIVQVSHASDHGDGVSFRRTRWPDSV